MASARRTGTNENISTYGGGGRDYTSLATWEAATDVDLVIATQSEVLECYADSASFDDAVELAGATTSADYFRIIRPAEGEVHDGTPGTGVRFDATSGIRVLDSAEDFSSFQDLVVSLVTNAASACFGILLDSGSGMDAVGCIVAEVTNSGAGSEQGFFLSGCDDSGLINCLVLDSDTRGVLHNASGNSNFLYNCTAIGNVIGFLNSNGTLTVKNCLGDGNGTDFSGTFSSSTNNASSDATAPGTSARTNQTFTYVDAGNDDYHLDSADAGAKDFGADLSADATFAFDDDIDGDTITTWSIGFDSLVASGSFSGSAAVIFFKRRRRVLPHRRL